MIFRGILTGLAAMASLGINAQQSLDAAGLASQIEGPLNRARYMEGACEPKTVAGWEGFETRRCTYTVKDAKTGTSKAGLVIMLNPSALQLGMWIINACAEVRPQQPIDACIDFLFRQIIDQSGGQFPVAGVVYEDILPRDGIHEAYGFRNGVTVLLSGLEHRGTDPIPSDRLEESILANVESTASKSAPARIVGVTREQYLKANPGASVDGLAWLATVAKEYQAAMRGSRNALLEAWLRSAP